MKYHVKRFFNEQLVRMNQRMAARELTQQAIRKDKPRLEMIKGPEGRSFLPRLDCLGLPL